MNLSNRFTRYCVLLITSIFACSTYAFHYSPLPEKPLILIGASYANGNTPLQQDLQGPLFGISVGAGDYVDLGIALSRFGAKVSNEGQAGATTFSRITCNPVCGTATWDSYSTQLQRALRRVTIFDANGPAGYNADYVIISLSNDCLHSDSFGMDQALTSPCSLAEQNASVDRLIAVGQEVLNLGMTPVYAKFTSADNLDLPLFAQLSGLTWVMTNEQYDSFGELYAFRISEELPGAILVNAWEHFAHRGDGIHPDDATTMRAAYHFLRAIYLDKQHQ
ncbi:MULTISPECIES: SGNH/GDSL hydrolase family protein [unclassified Ketobacter]|uniref:SGNH/GDSL hydrolase family protein n=1 Tax=unclassified Ketobacter TaxID=2639109 RepID=UPI000F2B2837|nr:MULTISPECIES: SGNH/GDSL hydrolase family protein [unclassified Ketobacter]RLT91032.1 MAG: SGNH/GDSL hydrolase family protein [Ketobacter sp. GenoA1]RLT98533.1 MAG: SGNH/GDSL hydrolase family protein [Ketobacter sp.]